MSNPIIPGTNVMLQVLRFPFHNYTIATASSYQGEVKKGFLTHWIYHVYKKGGTGEHAALREFTVRRTDDTKKRIVMCIWALTGGGKSTHSMYVFNKHNASVFTEKFGVDPTKYISDQVARNDDIVAIFEDQVIGSEKGSWTKTEDVDETQVAQWRAGMSTRALHENTEFGPDGNPSFKGELFQYFGRPNRNARTVFYLEDTGYFDGKVVSSEPLNTAVFISPGYVTDYAWVKIQDPAFAAKVLADGRSVGHPAIAKTGVGEELYETRYCLPFTMGVGNAAHVERFYGFLKKRKDAGDFIDVYLLNTTGKVGAEYEWTERQLDKEKVLAPKTTFKEVAGRAVPVGGTGPSIEETELFLLQAVRGAVKYQPHPIWGEKVLVPIEVEGISKARLKELNPFTYRSADEMKRLLKTQILISKYYLDKQCPGLPKYVYNAMDF
jgi:phosphoenolpyruvate carboxykinase (ATP)